MSVSGILKVIELGVMVILNNTNIVWCSNTSTVAKNLILQLLDSGNLVLREAMDDNPEHFLCQSFEYLSDTTLPSTKFGLNYVTGREIYLSPWRTNEDPSPGNFTFHLDPTGYPQVIIKRGNLSRTGPWNGIRLSKAFPTYRYELFMSKNGT
ncbi:G-type lectin S-receptor-like serine threonine-kinase At4g27290 isoform X2 [Olea europaea subsp. europaea]|uniref:G-type lectin S-receptor-like serine threonine-kinase At4g27290 isoform X2 n=1 Tax=Olea europaea subsp. europaea TaxID=158383 RepID=A0A8S0SL59_OLEEU|nr:G-type lectin S-receptor-like serine threonine-kinase At4g27290 isoform X2 [Olea europaea subsp. europaea]